MKKPIVHSGKIRREFPKISRFIPEKRGVRLFYFVTYCLILASITLISFQLAHDVKEEGSLKVTHVKLTTELTFWRWISKNYSGYRDAYFHVAVLDYQLGDLQDAKLNLEKVLEIDPNYQKGRELEKLLQQF